MIFTVLARLRQPFHGLKLGGMWWAWSLVLMATLTFSWSTPLGKAAINQGVNPTTLLVLRFGIALLLLTASFWLTAPHTLKIDRPGFKVALAAGLINGLGAVAFFWSLPRLDASIATMLFTLNPLVVLGLLALRGEKLTYRHLVRVALGLSGLYLVIGPQGWIDGLGVLLVMVSVCCVAIELVLIQWFLQNYDARTITLYVLLGMLTTISGYWLWQGAEWHHLSGPIWLLVGLLAVVCTYFSWWTYFTGLRQIGSGQVAMLIPLEMLLTVIWSFMLLGERFSFWQSVGAALVLLSALLAIQRLRWARWRPRWRAWRRV